MIASEISLKKSETEEVWITDFEQDSLIAFEEHVFEKFYKNPKKPIILKINSPGGSVDSAMGMLDVMDAVRSIADSNYFYFVTVALGRAMSAGALVLSHGDYRFCSPNARIMLHQANKFFFGGSKPEVEVEFNEFKRLNDIVLTTLAKNCNIKGGTKALSGKLARDLYLNPTQAREFGIIDVVGYPKLNEVTAYELTVMNGIKPEKKGTSDEQVRRATKRTPKKNPKG